MGRYPQLSGPKVKGSLRWIQLMVNTHPRVLNAAISLGPIDWRSPLATDEFAEYRDTAFLDKLDVKLPKVPLDSFWPARGPQWDALGRAKSGAVVLLEAKAHIAEIMSPGSKAGQRSSQELIRKALDSTARALHAKLGLDWTKRFYQYTNRLAHAYLFQELNEVRTRLVFVYFLNDSDFPDGPTSRREWEAAVRVLHEALGITGHVPNYVKDVFIDVRPPVPKVV